jgi:hypothetical protein
MSVQDGTALLYFLGIRRDGGASGGPPELTMSDWAQILRQAGQNGVTPLLYHRVRTTVPGPPVPPLVLDHLQDTAVRSAAQSLQTGRELAQVLEAFRRHGIAVIVLKGGHLGRVVYESSALRTMCDLDIMVRRDELTRAADVLAELGYVPQYYDVEVVDYARHHHLRPMARPDGIRVEIHWNIAPPASPFAIDLDGLWERAHRAEIVGVETLVLSPEDLVLHLCLHTSFSHKFRVGLRMCWDLLEVTRHYRDIIDWDLVARRARQWRIGKYVYLTLRLVRDLLAADIPLTAIAALEPPDFAAKPAHSSEVLGWARTCIFEPETAESVSAAMARLWTSRGFKAKLGVLLHSVCPSRTALARIYRIQPDSVGVFLYYPRRWADLLLRYRRHAWALWRGDHRAHDKLRAASARTALRDWLGTAG